MIDNETTEEDELDEDAAADDDDEAETSRSSRDASNAPKRRISRGELRIPVDAISDSENGATVSSPHSARSPISASSSSDDLHAGSSSARKSSRDLETIEEEGDHDSSFLVRSISQSAVRITRSRKDRGLEDTASPREKSSSSSTRSHSRTSSSTAGPRDKRRDKDKDRERSRKSSSGRTSDGEHDYVGGDRNRSFTEGSISSSRSTESLSASGSAKSTPRLGEEMTVKRLLSPSDSARQESGTGSSPGLSLKNLTAALSTTEITPREGSTSRRDAISARFSSLFKRPLRKSPSDERTEEASAPPALGWQRPLTETDELALKWSFSFLGELKVKIISTEISVVDLYRAVSSTVDAVMETYPNGPPADLESIPADQYGSIWSAFLLALPEPICTHRLFGHFTASAEIEHPVARQHAMRSLIWSLPGPHRQVLESLVNFVHSLGADAAKKIPHTGSSRVDFVCAWLAPMVFRPRIGRESTPNSPTPKSPLHSPRAKDSSHPDSPPSSPRTMESTSLSPESAGGSRSKRRSSSSSRDDAPHCPEDALPPPRIQGVSLAMKRLVEDRDVVFASQWDDQFVYDTTRSTSGCSALLVAASVDYLMETLCDERYAEPEFASLALLTLNNFLTPEDLLRRLFKLFEAVAADSKRLKDWQRARRLRLLFVLRLWFTQFQDDLQTNKAFVEQAEEFISSHAHDVLREEEAILSGLLAGLNQGSDKVRQRNIARGSPMLKALSMGDVRSKSLGPNGIFGLQPEVVAQQMCLIDVEHLRAITSRECFRKAYLDPLLSPNFNRMVHHFNTINLWVQTEVVGQSNAKHRTTAVDFFALLASKLVAVNNFHSAFAIYTALSGISISRLKLTWEKVSKKTRKAADMLASLFSMDRNMSKYRETLQKAELPAIPCLTVFSKDLFAIEEAVENKTEKSSSMINVRGRGHPTATNSFLRRFVSSHLVRSPSS